MPVQRIYRRREVQELFGNPPISTFYFWMKIGRVPKPDCMIGESTPGWFESTIERHQQETAERGTNLSSK
jgi:predicted DNA-binding transcriptional regulator AlpA